MILKNLNKHRELRKIDRCMLTSSLTNIKFGNFTFVVVVLEVENYQKCTFRLLNARTDGVAVAVFEQIQHTTSGNKHDN